MTIAFTPDSQPLTASSFEQIKKREFVPEHSLTGLKFFRDKARNERDLRELYRGRAPYELLQNADDSGASVVVFSLASDGMTFAHNGRWFNVGNFRSLADGWSDKDPNECIGHKGLGFRSVLDISPCPHLIQVDKSFLGIKFGWATNNNHVQQTLAHDNSLKTLYNSWTQTGQRVCPVMGIPVLAKKDSLGGGLTAFNRFLMDRSLGLTTMFWLPARDPELPKTIMEELSTEPITSGAGGQERLLKFLVDEVDVVLPFLSSVRRILIMDGTSLIGKAEVEVASETASERRISVTTDASSKSSKREFFQMMFHCPIPQKVLNAAGTPRAVRQLKVAELTLAVRMQGGEPTADPDARFQVYFPTEQVTGFGFLVHGDFHVQPDRKYLVAGDYNNWLFGEGAKSAANAFMSTLLRDHSARTVFSALAPTERIRSGEEAFSTGFANALRSRRTPFVPTSDGNGLVADVLLAPSSDCAAFWEARFGKVISHVCPGKRAFVASEPDQLGSRAFMRFAGVEVAGREKLIPLVEMAGVTDGHPQSPQWWYECYSHIASDVQLARSLRDAFIGRYLILGSSGQVVAVRGEDGLLVCLHPDDKSRRGSVPPLLEKTFAFVDQELSSLLEDGPDEVLSWILNRFHISRFEASDIIPRSVRGVAPRLFDGSLRAQYSDIIDAWRFVRDLVENSRSSFSDDFWASIGRLPVYAQSAASGANPATAGLIPCAASYWPDQLLPSSASISGTTSLRRMSPDFISDLSDGQDGAGWQGFLYRAGASDIPKVLSYARVAVGSDELVIGKSTLTALEPFNGERQHDVNRVISEAVALDQIWSNYVDSISDCGHGVQRVVQSLSMIEGFSDCCELAQKEFLNVEPRWAIRLNDLVSRLRVDVDTKAGDAVYCRGGRQGGHTIIAPNYVSRQLAELRWLPSTAGPAAIDECFLRRSTHKLISDTRSGDSVNDWLLPSVVIDDPQLFLRLSQFGVHQLEDAAANTATLVRALKEIGLRMSEQENADWVFESPARWRAVRGAIQGIYRTLNQRDDLDQTIQTVRFAITGRDKVTFDAPQLYYAEPGPVRDAFAGILPLIDSDRVFAALFEAIGIVQLTPGSTVVETVKYENEPVPNNRLQTDISERLSPYLIALGRAKTDSQAESQSTRRTLLERFTVLCVPELKVEFSLAAGGDLPVVSSPPLPFYLRRRVISRGGAISEAHYTLFVAADPEAGLLDIDADALGSALVPVFQDRPSADIAAMFARTAVRYKDLRGDSAAMREFMYTHLGVSYEVMETVDQEESGQLDTADSESPPPPPVKLVGQASEYGQQTLAQAIEAKEDEIKRKALDAVGRVAHAAGGAGIHHGAGTSGGSPPITPEQQARGLAGETEIRRRLCRPGGWEGLVLFKDTRNDGCGYDFEAKRGEQTVRLEVKTFNANGRVVVTNRELQAAAEYRAEYYLIGVRDSEAVHPSRWLTYEMQDPVLSLLSLGEFVVEAKLQVNASSLFAFQDETFSASRPELGGQPTPQLLIVQDGKTVKAV